MNKSLTLVLAGVAVAVTACASSPGTSSPGVNSPGTSSPVTSSQGASSQGGGTGQQSAGASYSLAFARCMRVHGVAKFPDPGRNLGPDSGAGLGSPAFQAAVNGPCRSLAPPAWVSPGVTSGQGTGGS
jgi:hypothetical protein